jgi:BMFP domain-containing protein YqiC
VRGGSFGMSTLSMNGNGRIRDWLLVVTAIVAAVSGLVAYELNVRSDFAKLEERTIENVDRIKRLEAGIGTPMAAATRTELDEIKRRLDRIEEDVRAIRDWETRKHA